MKTLSFILCFILLANMLLSQNSVKPDDKTPRTCGIIDLDQAHLIAQRFLMEQKLKQPNQKSPVNLSLSKAKILKVNNEPALYVFSNHGVGFVIVSADSALPPVIGYSSESNFPEPGVCPGFDNYLETYLEQVNWVRENKILKTPEIEAQWETFLEDEPGSSDNEFDGVEPLLNSIWSQGYPYNAFCPKEPKLPGGHAPAGCAATAVGMIMYYYRYPLQGTGADNCCSCYGNQFVNFGASRYNWDGMLDQLSNNSGECIPAVAQLLYHAGVSISTNYGPNGSPICSYDISQPLMDHFGYSSLTKNVYRCRYTTAEWENMVVEQLDSLRPVYYAGKSSTKGHAFVCDGYQVVGTEKFFHFNFGWGGDGNAYYTLYNPSGFTMTQNILINFYPGNGYPYGCSNHIINDANGSFEDGSSPRCKYKPNLNCSWLIDPADSVNSITLTFNAFNVDKSDTLFIYDGENEAADLIHAFTGVKIPPAVTSSGSKLFLKFKTDGSNESKGWMAEYHSVYPDFCNETTTFEALSGSFSDGSGNRDYNNQGNCKWIIQPYENGLLELSFRSFELEENDRLKIYSTKTPDSFALLGTLTGKSIPDPLVSPTGSMLVVFETDDFYTAGGFEAEYTSLVIDKDKSVISHDINLWPNPAGEFCILRLNNAQKQERLLSIRDMDGRMMYTALINTNRGGFEQYINLFNYKPGVYLLSDK